MADKIEKVMELINKLLSVTTENGATENEAIEASLKVQKLLAKYDIELGDVNKSKEDIVMATVKTSNDLWRIDLANIVANNFCCKVFGLDSDIVFYGYKRHCEVAKAVFISIYEFGRARAKKLFKDYRDAGLNPKGIKNQFYIGFLHGVKSALDAQTTQLAIVTPQAVTEAYDELMQGARHVKRSIHYTGDADVYARGYKAGQEAATQKTIENN